MPGFSDLLRKEPLENTMKVILKQTNRPLHFEAMTDLAKIEVSANLEENGPFTFRPMELLLTSLASCSAIDIENILRKQKIKFTDFQIEIIGNRADTIPSVFTKIDLVISISGDINESRLGKAIHLTKEKYCSVYRMLFKEVEINYSYVINSFK